MSAHGGKADIPLQGRDFRFDPTATSASLPMLRWRSGFQPLPKRTLELLRCHPMPLGANMKRREFIVGLAGAAATLFASNAQERVKRPRVGFLMHLAPGDSDAMARVAGFLQGLQELGWATDRNIQIDYRWAAGQDELYRKYAAELVALQPDVLVTTVTDTVRALQRATRTIPIVFTSVIDPVGSGLITRSAFPWFESYQAASASLYDQVWMTGWRLTSSMPAIMRSLSSCFEVTRMWRKTDRANLEKKPSMRLSQEPCLGVKVNAKRPGGRASSQALVSLEMWAE